MRVVDANMERAVRVVTVERGVDARELVLVAFGGAGPLHACAVADALDMRAVLVPPRAGVLSAVGSCRRRPSASSSGRGPTRRTTRASTEARAALRAEVSALEGLAGAPAEVETFLDCRYAGQSHELTVAEIDEFPAEHARRNGYARPGIPIEVVALRARAAVPRPSTRPSCRQCIENGSSAPPSPPSPTAPSGSPTAGPPTPPKTAPGS